MNFKVYLSPIEEGHLVRYMSLSDDPELIDTMGWRPFQAGEEERFLRTLEVLTLPRCGDGGAVTFSIVTKEGNCPIGYVTLKGINREALLAELGIAIMDGRYRSGGYGSDALTLALDYAFSTLHLRVVGLTVFPSNTKALRAYEKAGFKRVAVLEQAWMMPDGEQADMLLMECIKDT